MKKKNTIWITGANSGIGKAIAQIFIRNNHHVIGTARNENKLEPFTENVINQDLFTFFSNDISNSEEVFEFYNNASAKFNINCLINNAGITSFKPFVENTLDEIDSIIKTNLNGSIYAIKAVLPEMIKNRSGIIINILSVAAKTVFTNSSIYAASKAGLEAFSKVIREELRNYNIKVINIFPGATATQIWPEHALRDNADKMMTADNLAEFVFDIFRNSVNLSPEEIVIRPISGDL